ncbi:hypothetical protein Vadar_025130 [Vaccinium darrowii]|uniref:Uncharacterized protein n=1 Tax=Vaccinium darrowii TaxID=229202 RepID=A0ACB7X3X8_9ERIC|nr:hypothetical protein Vadar_025130 [Vaccinium darrowii]
MARNRLLTPQYQHHKDNPNCLIIVPLFLQQECLDHLYLIDNIHKCDKENEIRDGKFLDSINQSMIDKGFVFNTILSSNGLLCLLFCKVIGLVYRVCLYNPLTSEHHFFADPELARAGNPTRSIINPVTSSHCFGFGYDSRNRKYKFVRIEISLRDQKSRRNGTNSWTCLIEVLTLGENGSHRLYNRSIRESYSQTESSGVELGGAIHWLWKGTISKNYIIISFDLLKENWVVNEKPSFVIGTDYILSVLGGCLALTVSCGNQVVIWKMKEYGVSKSWTREFVIRGRFPITLGSPGMIYPLFVLSSGKLLVSYKNEALYSYDSEDKCFEAIYVPALVPKYFKAVCFTPSLVSPII